MIHPVLPAGEELNGLNAILGNADARLEILVEVSTAGMSNGCYKGVIFLGANLEYPSWGL